MIAEFLAAVRRNLGEDLHALVHWTPRRRPPHPGRALVGVALAVAAFALYLALAIRLDSGAYFAIDNFAFDFDPLRNTAVMFNGDVSGGLRHPLMSALRPLAEGVLHLGLPLNLTMSLLFAAIGTVAVFVVFACTAQLGVPLLESTLLTGFYAISSTPVFLALVPESYGLSALGLWLLYLVVMKRQDAPESYPRARFALALYLFGVTITNIIQPAIAETVIWFRRLPPVAAVARLTSYGLILGVLIVLAILASINWHYFLHDPVVATKLAYWETAEHGEEKASFAMLLKTFFLYSFVAPDFTSVPLPNGEATMLDFRDFRMTTIGLGSLVLWLALLAMGFFTALRDRVNRTVFLSAAAAILVNLLMHLSVQYRASVYIYAAHLHVPIFVLALFAGRSARGRSSAARWTIATGLAALVVLAGINNLTRAVEFVGSFG